MSQLCSNCKYAKKSGDFYVCDLGVRETKVWGNSESFGCIKWKEK